MRPALLLARTSTIVSSPEQLLGADNLLAMYPVEEASTSR
jgi:hypothetical protein